MNFYSHAPRGARRPASGHTRRQSEFLLTRPSRGATTRVMSWIKKRWKFLLTRPSRGATMVEGPDCVWSIISTHTPLAGRDVYWAFVCSTHSLFLLTRPSRGATEHFGQTPASAHFYSHAPRGARLSCTPEASTVCVYFYSHAPRGARPVTRDAHISAI